MTGSDDFSEAVIVVRALAWVGAAKRSLFVVRPENWAHPVNIHREDRACPSDIHSLHNGCAHFLWHHAADAQ